tara:strand:+ start:385 stop:603 length:219 start_codon:yes stop_codon:yes gene_type:complete
MTQYLDIYGSIEKSEWKENKEVILFYSVDGVNYNDNDFETNGYYNVNIRIEEPDLKTIVNYLDVMETKKIQL